jgi:beta-glucosidase
MWEYHPQGLTYMLDFFYKKYGKPMIITESGLCSNNDELRIKAIDDYLLAVQAAIDKGTPVLGYTHWSTFDNHEWSLGNTYRFGLVHVDFETMQRTAKPSAHHYRALIDSKNKNR